MVHIVPSSFWCIYETIISAGGTTDDSKQARNPSLKPLVPFLSFTIAFTTDRGSWRGCGERSTHTRLQSCPPPIWLGFKETTETIDQTDDYEDISLDMARRM